MLTETAPPRAAAADGAHSAPRKTTGLRPRRWRRARPAAEAVAGPLRRRQSHHVWTVDDEELHLPPGGRRPRLAAPDDSLARGPPAWRAARQPSPAYLAASRPARSVSSASTWAAGLVGAVYCRERCVKQRINTRCSSLSTYGHWRSDPTHENRAHMSSVHVVGPGVPRGGRGDPSRRTRRRQLGWRWLAGRAPRRRPTGKRIFGCCTPWMSSAGRQVQLRLVDGPCMSR